MIWAVLDTNTLVSGLGWPDGPPGQIIDLALDGRFLPVTSRSLLEEFGRVIEYPKLQAMFADPMSYVLLVETMSIFVDPSTKVNAVSDPADNHVLEAAREAHADFVVTGDNDLLELENFEGSEILTPKEFLRVIEMPNV